MKKEDLIYLEDIEYEKSGTKYTFVSYLREDWVQRSLVVELDSGNIIKSIFINSNEYGTTEWINGKGFISSNYWEDEDMAQSVSELSKQYTAILSNGATSLTFAQKFIIPDVLQYFANQELANKFREILMQNEFKQPLDLAQYNLKMSYH